MLAGRVNPKTTTPAEANAWAGAVIVSRIVAAI